MAWSKQCYTTEHSSYTVVLFHAHKRGTSGLESGKACCCSDMIMSRNCSDVIKTIKLSVLEMSEETGRLPHCVIRVCLINHFLDTP